MEKNNLTDLILKPDELANTEKKIKDLEFKKQELEKKIRISNMIVQLIKQVIENGILIDNEQNKLMQTKIKDDFCYNRNENDNVRLKIVKNAYQREDDCEVLRKIFENCGFKYFFFTETKNEERNYLNQTINYGHIIITQILSIPLSEYEILIEDLTLNTAIEDKNKIYFKALEKGNI